MMCRFDDKVKDYYGSLPFVTAHVDRNEYPLLTDTEFDLVTAHGHSAILCGEIQMSEEGGFVDEDDVPNRRTVSDIINDANWEEKYQLDPDRELTPDEEAYGSSQGRYGSCQRNTDESGTD